MKCPICLGVKLSHEDECADCRAPLPEPPQGPRELANHKFDTSTYVHLSSPERLVDEQDRRIAELETLLGKEYDHVDDLKRAYDRVVQERDELAITAARLFSDAGRLTEERDRLRAALNFTSADYEAPCTAGNPADSDCATTREESR